MASSFRIPKQTDTEIAKALVRIAAAVSEKCSVRVFATVPVKGNVEVPKNTPDEAPELKFVFSQKSQLVDFYLKGPTRPILTIKRNGESITDTATIPDNWAESWGDDLRQIAPDIYITLLASARKELKAPEVEAAFASSDDNSWSRYRDAQTAVVNSLQQATETLIVEASQKSAELDKARAERFEKLERDLREQLDQERKSLQELHDQRIEALRAKEKALADKEASFETKESHYVARQKQAEQIKQVQEWLKKWDLTEGTRLKRRPVMWLYVAATITTGLLTLFTVMHSFNILDSAESVAKLAWWQWAMLWVKTALPLGAFITFIVYFIRWYGDWARQHSEEEFRNRTLLVDIGRASWLLEAVRDAQERDKEIPKELLHELSRDLFSHTSKSGSDIHPQALSDLLMQGLSSIRLKSADGSEVEATRGKRA